MDDFENFQMAVQKDQEENEGGGSSGYMSSLVNSMSLMLEEFYSNLDVVGVSSYTGQGFDEFMDAVDNKVDEYNEYYKAERERILKKKEEDEKKRQTKSLNKLMKDMDIKGKKKLGEKQGEVLSDFDDDDEEDEVDEDLQGEVLPDEEEEEEGDRALGVPSREYAFAEDRQSELDAVKDADLQARYQQAMEARGKPVSSKTAENIANYINRTQ